MMNNRSFPYASLFLCTALAFGGLQACGGSSSSVTSLPVNDTTASVEENLSAQVSETSVFTLSAPIGPGAAAGSLRIDVKSTQPLPETITLQETPFVQLPISPQGAQSYAAAAADALKSLESFSTITLAGVTEASITITNLTTDEASVSLIYEGNPTEVTFNDYVLVRATADLPPNLRTAENIATRANELFPAGNFQAEDLDPIPNQINTEFVAGGQFPPPDLDDALVMYAATFLQPNQRTRENLAEIVNALAPDANLDPDDITQIPGGELPGGVVVDPFVSERAAGTFQISVLDEELETPSFAIGATEFVQLPEIFPGFTSYGAEPQSSFLIVAFDQISIPEVDSSDCVIVHLPGQDPLSGVNQIARSAGCEFAPTIGNVRVAQFNASLNRNNEGDLVTDLSTPDNPQAQTVAEIIQRVNPDLLLVNEFDFVADGSAAELFRDNYLAVSQNGAPPALYPYFYIAPSNTGVLAPVDLDDQRTTDGSITLPSDAFGFGFFPGQFAMVIYSKFPIDEANIRTFQTFLWKDMPGNLLTADPAPSPNNLTEFYSQAAIDVFRLSSKSHWDVPITLNGQTLHLLASHPTPPVFDGPEDRNGKRNFDEIRFWRDYITPGDGEYIYDDLGSFGGLTPGASFVIMGDQNSDPNDGDSLPGAADQILDSPLTNTSLTPSSLGGTDAAARQGGANNAHISDPAFDTADFNDDPAPGNLRADYVLPSIDLTLNQARVFWPPEGDPLFPLVGNFPFPSSDHRLVWIDVEF